MRGGGALIYLGLSAVAAFVATFALLLSGAPPLAAAHAVFAFGIVPLIFGAVSYFVPVLTRGGKAHRAVSLAPLLLQLAGLSAVLHFGGIAGRWALHAAAGAALLVALAFCGWLIVRARRTLGQPHSGWRWYLAAAAMLSAALAAVLLLDLWPGAYRELRLLHLHLNALGFVGLSAIGTLQVLLPTALGDPDAGAASRLRGDFRYFAGAVLAVAVGAGFSLPLALAGAFVLVSVVLRLALGWLHVYGLRRIVGDGASVALAAALCGFMLLVLSGVLHAFGRIAGRDAGAAFAVLFLLPLVTGALSQLLPVWRWPGVKSQQRGQMRALLAGGGRVRAAFFLTGGAAIALGSAEGFWLAAVGLSLFVVRLLKSFRLA